MPTLYVENVPDELYDALRQRARQNRKSIAAEVLTLLTENIPTSEELKRRKRISKQLAGLQKSVPLVTDSFLTTEQMLRQDRER